MCANQSSIMVEFPTEVLFNIFAYLEAKHLPKCREVCWRWKLIIDEMFNNEILWMKHCQRDFKENYEAAYRKRESGISWHNLYRSLSLWSKFHDASEIQDEFASASYIADEVRDFQLLGCGEVGVHTRTGIVYYDLKTLKQSDRGIISGDYLCYVENDDVILILGFSSDLHVIRKAIRSPLQEETSSFPSVKNFLVANNTLYYVTFDYGVYTCNLQCDKIESNLIAQTDLVDGVLCLGYKNSFLNILTYQRNIYTVVGQNIIYQRMLDDAPNLMQYLQKYNFLENLDWRVYYQWLFVLNRTIPRGSIRDIIVVKLYGEVVFVGTSVGVFRIYYAPYVNNEFDLYKSEPLKQYNFSERTSCPVMANSPIIQIDVLEGIDSHTVLVGMPKRIAVLKFSHDFARPGSNFEAYDVNVLDMST